MPGVPRQSWQPEMSPGIARCLLGNKIAPWLRITGLEAQKLHRNYCTSSEHRSTRAKLRQWEWDSGGGNGFKLISWRWGHWLHGRYAARGLLSRFCPCLLDFTEWKDFNLFKDETLDIQEGLSQDHIGSQWQTWFCLDIGIICFV